VKRKTYKIFVWSRVRFLSEHMTIKFINEAKETISRCKKVGLRIKILICNGTLPGKETGQMGLVVRWVQDKVDRLRFL
jgi:hypothetical protein